MPASLRSVSHTTFKGPSGTIEPPLGVQAGDLLVAWQSADGGSNSGLNLTGGSGGWQSRASVPGGTWAGTRIWQRTATASEPDTYTASQSALADGTIIIAAIRGADPAAVTIIPGSGVDTPGATPATASGLQLRYAAGLTQFGGEISWTPPAGWGSTQVQSHPWTSACLASRTYSSSAALPDVPLEPSVALYVSHAFTVLVGSAAPPPAPEAPTYPAWAAGRGTTLYQYVFRRLLDRAYLGTLDLVGVTFDKRIGQAGAFTATIPIPSRRVGDQVAEIIPRDETYLDRGPGVITCEIYRGGEVWGEYWITAASPSRSQRGTPAISLRGSTLDAYLDAVEIQEDLAYSTDQIEILRSLITHAQAQAHTNISLVVDSGSSGVSREHTYLAEEKATYGARLRELAAVQGGFEWMINHIIVSGAVQRRVVWGYPTLGESDPQHVFVDSPHGGDILSWAEEIDALRGATRWRASGTSGDTGDASTASTALISTFHEATAHLAAHWPRIDRTVSYDVSDPGLLESYAAYWAANASGALRVDQFTVALGAEPTLTPNRLGDTARIYLENEWHLRHSRTRRIIGMGVTPVSRENSKEEAQIVVEGRDVDA